MKTWATESARWVGSQAGTLTSYKNAKTSSHCDFLSQKPKIQIFPTFLIETRRFSGSLDGLNSPLATGELWPEMLRPS